MFIKNEVVPDGKQPRAIQAMNEPVRDLSALAYKYVEE